MPYNNLTSRISSNPTSIPEILVGPILRRVEKDNVTVFIASRVCLDSTLKIYNSDTNDSNDLMFQSVETTSYKIGKSLYVSYITASTTNSLNYLEENTKYYYNIFFDNNKSLLTVDVFGDLNDILYGGEDFPNFIFVPDNIEDLKIAHGSCRKPHTSWSDSFLAVDKMIEDISSEDIRPNLLCLTGDQIYADDVSDTMLFLIRDTQKALIDFNEQVDCGILNFHEKKLISKVKVKSFKEIKKAFKKEQDEEGNIVINDSNFDFENKILYDYFDSKIFNTASEEFNDASLYVRKVKGEIESENDFVSNYEKIETSKNEYTNQFKQLYKEGSDNFLSYILNNEKLVLDNLIPGTRGPIINGTGLTVDSKFELNHNNIGKSHLISYGEFISMYLLVWSNKLWFDADNYPSFEEVYAMEGTGAQFIKKNRKNFIGRSKKLFKRKIEESAELSPEGFNYVPSKYHNTYKEEKKHLLRFAENLKRIRRVMAHVPIYMVFDDHEITDDVFLNIDWINNDETGYSKENNHLAKRVISNGLTALTIFQSWGNNPEYFNNHKNLDSNSKNILEYINYEITTNSTLLESSFASIQEKILPILTTSLSNSGESMCLHSDFNYNFTINYNDFTLTGMDTRTKRGFSHECLLNLYAGYYNKDQPPFNNTIEDDPAALINDLSLENLIDNIPNNKALTIFLSPYPVAGHTSVESLSSFMINNFFVEETVKNLKTQLDYEAWFFNRHCYELLMQKLTRFNKIIFISGDVHYGFSQEGKYWDRRNLTTNEKLDKTLDDKKYAYAQLTSSSIKNQSPLTRKTKKLPQPKIYRFGWQVPGNHVLSMNINKWLGGIFFNVSTNIFDPEDPDRNLQEFFSGIKMLPNFEPIKITPESMENYSEISNLEEVYFPSVFDGRANMVDLVNNPSKMIKQYFVKKVNKIKDSFRNFKDWAELFQTHSVFLKENSGWLKDNSDELLEHYKNLEQEWEDIRDNWQTFSSDYFIGSKLIWLEEKRDFLLTHFSNIQQYFTDIEQFFNDPVLVKFLFPINVYYKFNNSSEINHFPDWFYWHDLKTDPRSFKYRFYDEYVNNLGTDYGIEDQPSTTKEKYQKLSFFGHFQWQSIGRTIIGENNIALITFNWDENEQKVLQTFWSDPMEYTYSEVSGMKYKNNLALNLQTFLRPYSRHEVSLNEPLDTDKPELLQ